LIVVTLLAVAGWYLLRLPQAPIPEPIAEGAFLHAEWGMSPEQVSEANGTPLEPSTTPVTRFMELGPGEETRYRILEARNQNLLGRESILRYTFKDNRLAGYYLFIPDSDCEALDRDARAYLYMKFGSSAENIDEGTPLSLVWQSNRQVVNYWFIEDEIALAKPCRAVVGVVAQPRE
jgi:hypothetical protein